MILYTVEPYSDDDIGHDGLTTLADAREWGDEFCPHGYDIDTIDTDDLEYYFDSYYLDEE